ncbi:hypothetical protein HN371_13840 [Candidatus Poribacteria bacterium]|jgi:hypothetical protein|nr:hypothetical protein [Candidatus Poribacteria bacterium]MBT5531824.1 hypothetical protein [Candidatus Poribacteria bacterium]MBT5713097.1 hypothetical protein [Candidatus Poribacteria bacterium]MBT7804655.1 hypothetical protein [Candidatus Poribacteria bacterium]
MVPRSGLAMTGGLAARVAMWTAVAVVAAAGCGAGPPGELAPVERGTAARARPPVVGAYVTYHAHSRVVTIGNALLARRLKIADDDIGFGSVSLRSLPTGVEILSGPQHDFALSVGGRSYTTGNGSLQYIRHDTSSDGRGGQSLRLYLRPIVPGGPDAAPFELTVVYEVAKDEPIIQTWGEVANHGDVPLLIEDAATQITTVAPDAAYVWRRGGRAATTTLPVAGGAEHGLVWLRSSTGRHGPLIVGLASAVPGPLKRIAADRAGGVAVGMAARSGGIWVQPRQTVALPSAYVWASVGPLVAQAARDWMDAIDLARRSIDAAGSVDDVSVADGELNATWLESRAPDAIVCVPYAWQSAWDDDDERDRVTAATRTIAESGRRVGLHVPVAWLPDGGALAADGTFALTTAVGDRFSASWRGRPGMVASLSSGYGELALRSLVALVDDLGLHAVLLDGPVTAPVDSGGSADDPLQVGWGSWDGLLRLVTGLKRERPDIHIGVSASTYGQDDGFDVALHPTSFLWQYGRTANYDGFWRTVERAPISGGGSLDP